MTNIHPAAHIGMVALKVENLPLMSEFYQEIIGLDVKKQTETEIQLGNQEDEKILLRLQKVTPQKKSQSTTGLYHIAFLLPERKDLGDSLYHLLKVNYPLAGASDHGYSEAIYLTDPEGNGIEIYRDKPKEVWTIESDGRIEGITIEMDAEGVLGEATGNFRGMPSGTTVGHVHLTVADLAKTEDFYVELIGMSLKSTLQNSAKFIAAGDYHHHIGTNIWSGRHLPPLPEDMRGLNYFTIEVPLAEDTQAIALRLNDAEYPFEWRENDTTLAVTDPNGIHLLVKVEK